MLRAASPLWKGEGVLQTAAGAFVGLVPAKHKSATGKLLISAALRKPHSHLHLQRQRKDIEVIATEHTQAQGGCLGQTKRH